MVLRLALTGAVSLALLAPMVGVAASISSTITTTSFNTPEQRPERKKVAASGVRKGPATTQGRQAQPVRSS